MKKFLLLFVILLFAATILGMSEEYKELLRSFGFTEEEISERSKPKVEKKKPELIGNIYIVPKSCDSFASFYKSLPEFKRHLQLEAYAQKHGSFYGDIERLFIDRGNKIKIISKTYVEQYYGKIYLYKVYSYHHERYLYVEKKDLEYYIEYKCFKLVK